MAATSGQSTSLYSMPFSVPLPKHNFQIQILALLTPSSVENANGHLGNGIGQDILTRSLLHCFTGLVMFLPKHVFSASLLRSHSTWTIEFLPEI